MCLFEGEYQLTYSYFREPSDPFGFFVKLQTFHTANQLVCCGVRRHKCSTLNIERSFIKNKKLLQLTSVSFTHVRA